MSNAAGECWGRSTSLGTINKVSPMSHSCQIYPRCMLKFMSAKGDPAIL